MRREWGAGGVGGQGGSKGDPQPWRRGGCRNVQCGRGNWSERHGVPVGPGMIPCPLAPWAGWSNTLVRKDRGGTRKPGWR